MREKVPSNQMIPAKAPVMDRMVQGLQRVAERGYRRACGFFCCSLDALLCQQLSFCPGQNHQQTRDRIAQAAQRSPPSTILIVNISNSTLTNCVIGNEAYPSAVMESQPLRQAPEPHMHDHHTWFSRRHWHADAAHTPLCPPAQPPSINIQDSNLTCVIIGDDNYMITEYACGDLDTLS